MRRVSCVINKTFNLPHCCLGPQDLIPTIWRSHFLFDIWLLERLWCSYFLPNPKNCTKPGLRWKAAIVIRQKGNNCSRTVLRPSSWHFPIDQNYAPTKQADNIQHEYVLLFPNQKTSFCGKISGCTNMAGPPLHNYRAISFHTVGNYYHVIG